MRRGRSRADRWGWDTLERLDFRKPVDLTGDNSEGEMSRYGMVEPAPGEVGGRLLKEVDMEREGVEDLGKVGELILLKMLYSASPTRTTNIQKTMPIYLRTYYFFLSLFYV